MYRKCEYIYIYIGFPDGSEPLGKLSLSLSPSLSLSLSLSIYIYIYTHIHICVNLNKPWAGIPDSR